MNLVQTIPELHTARLSGARGVGYAEVISSPGKKEKCRGVIVFDEDIDIAQISTVEAIFEGIVYREGGESIETFPVDILLVNEDLNQEPGATFVAKNALV